MTNSPIPGDVVARLREEFIPVGKTGPGDLRVLQDRKDALAYIEALQRELGARNDTMSLLESNARVQATLLADTGRELAEKTDLANKVIFEVRHLSGKFPLDANLSDLEVAADDLTFALKYDGYPEGTRPLADTPSVVRWMTEATRQRDRAEAAESKASSARQLALEALSISIYRVEDENDIVLSVFGQIVAEWDQNSPEAVSILKLAAAIRDIKGAGSGAEVKL